MTQFEDLAKNVQTLILAKLAIELNKYQCGNLQELARHRRTGLMDMWRVVCQSSKQPLCSIPREAMPREATASHDAMLSHAALPSH